MIKIIGCSLAVFMGVGAAFGQSDIRQQYVNGKNFFMEAKYNLAMETLKKVIPYDASNPYSQYASFYYSISAYRQGYLSVAKDMLNQIKKLYPSWDKVEEVNFWLGTIHMDKREYFQALNLWRGIQDPSIKKDIDGLKKKYLSEIDDPETLRMMTEEYPDDRLVGYALAQSLAKNLSDPLARDQFEETVKKYRLKRADFINEAPPTYFKDVYTVSTLYPFMLKTLEPTPSRKRNQLILDLYEGMKLAVDTLSKKGIVISLRAYDTERSPSTLKRLLETEELLNSDLIIGPFFPDENTLVLDFSMKNRINMFKPFTNNLEMIGVNEFGYLFQPSYETIGQKSAGFVADHVSQRKNCMVFYGPTKKDSILAASFVLKASESGLRVVASQRINKDATGTIIKSLATPTEFDEWKNPIEFELKKDSIGSIYVASDDALIYSKVISSVETRGDSILVVGSESWLNQAAMDYDKLQSLGIVLSAPNFTSPNNPYNRAFIRKYLRTHGQFPSEYAKLGYELMLFLGNSLHEHGVYFQEAFSTTTLRGYLYEGHNYQFSHDDQLVPFVKFEGGQLTVVENR
jgi:tetratricopeptide (TPR) repeat protein